MAKKEYKKPLVYVQKTGNTKKQYQAPKATVYKSADVSKAIKQSNRTYRGGNGYFAKTLVASAVSILILIGLIATVFLAYDNSQRADGEPFVYFSPAHYLQSLSTIDAVVESQTVQVTLRYGGMIAGSPAYLGEIELVGKRYISDTSYEAYPIVVLSENRLTNYMMMRGSQFEFVVGDTRYTSYDTDDWIIGQTVKAVTVEETNYDVFSAPDFRVVSDAWASVGDDETFFSALGVTADFIGDFLDYQLTLLNKLLPWNSIVKSDKLPSDGVSVDIPWR